MAKTLDQDISLDLKPLMPWGAMLGRAFSTLVNSPSLLVPPMFVGLAHLSLYAVFGYVFITSLAAKMAELHYMAWDMNVVRLTATLMRVSWTYMLSVLGVVMLGRLFIGTFHNSGWSAMFAQAARTGRAALVDYGYGVFMFSPRFLGAVFVKLCIHLIPALFVLIMLVLLRTAGNVLWGDVLKVALPFLPVVLVLELFIGLALMFWRQSLALEGAGAVESLARSFVFVRTRLGDVLTLLGLWLAYNMVVSMAFAMLGAVLMQAVPSDIGPESVTLRLVLYINTAFMSWLFQFIGMVFFVLLGFVLYYERAVAPFEEPALETGQDAVPLSQVAGPAAVVDEADSAAPEADPGTPADSGALPGRDADTDAPASPDIQADEAESLPAPEISESDENSESGDIQEPGPAPGENPDADDAGRPE
jgi:hypothetical protein